MACARTDGGMSDHPKLVLQPQKSALRFFMGKYLQKLGGDFASPDFVQLGIAHG